MNREETAAYLRVSADTVDRYRRQGRLPTRRNPLNNRPYWDEQEIEVVLEPYRYPEHQQAMEETCRRFNAANIRWRDDRLLRIRVAPAA